MIEQGQAFEMDLGDLAPVEVPVRIGGKDFVLVEASADAVKRFRAKAMQGVQRGEDGKITGLGGSAEAEPLLVSLCLFPAMADDRTKADRRMNVPLQSVMSWPNRVVAPLFNRAKEISQLDLDDKPEIIRRQIDVLQRRLKELEPKGNSKTDSEGGEGGEGNGGEPSPDAGTAS